MREPISMNSYIWFFVVFIVVFCGLLLLIGKAMGDSDNSRRRSDRVEQQPPSPSSSYSESPENRKL